MSDYPILNKILNCLKKNDVVQAMFSKFSEEVDGLDEVDISFEDMDVSAKTKKGKIILNKNLVEDYDFWEDLHYIVHELCHYLQQKTGEVFDYGDLGKYEYLEKPTEIEAFKYQIQFIEDYKGEEAAQDYLEELLDFHEYEGEDRERKRKEILGE